MDNLWTEDEELAEEGGLGIIMQEFIRQRRTGKDQWEMGEAKISLKGSNIFEVSGSPPLAVEVWVGS